MSEFSAAGCGAVIAVPIGPVAVAVGAGVVGRLQHGDGEMASLYAAVGLLIGVFLTPLFLVLGAFIGQSVGGLVEVIRGKSSPTGAAVWPPAVAAIYQEIE